MSVLVFVEIADGKIKKAAYEAAYYASKTAELTGTTAEAVVLGTAGADELANLGNFGIAKIEIERDGKKVKISIHCAKPGLVIGKGGAEIEKLKAQCEAMLKKPVAINIVEVKAPELDAQLVAENVAQQLEKRISFRRAMKQSIGNAMRRGAKGIKIMCSGRLGGAEIARSEQYHEGTIPLQTLRADIDYGFAEANTTYGKIGVKVWLYKGEVLNEVKSRKPRREGGRK